MADAAIDLRTAMGVRPIDPAVVARLEADARLEAESNAASNRSTAPVPASDPPPDRAPAPAAEPSTHVSDGASPAEATPSEVPIALPTIPPQLQTPFVLAVARGGGTSSAEWAARFEGWLRGQNLTLTTASPTAAEDFLASVGRDAFKFGSVRKMLRLATEAGIPMTPQAMGESPQAEHAAKRAAAKAAEKEAAKIAARAAPAPSSTPQIDPSPTPTPTPTPTTPAAAPVFSRAEAPKRPAAGAAAGPYVPRFIEIEMASDGVNLPGTAVGARASIGIYPGDQVAAAGSLTGFVQEQILPFLPHLRPGTVAHFYFCELNERRTKTGREWPASVFVRAVGGQPPGFGYGVPQAPPPYGAPPYGANPYMPQPPTPQMNPVEQAAGIAYVEHMKKMLDVTYDKQIAQAKAAAGGDPNTLYQLQRDIDRRYDEMLREIRDEGRRREASSAPSIQIPMPAPAHDDESEKLLAKLLDKAFDRGDKPDPTLKALEILQKLQPPAPVQVGTSPEVAELKAQLAAMQAENRQKEREDKLRDEIAGLRTKIAEIGGTGGLQGIGTALRQVREIAEDTGMVGSDPPEDDILKLALKNPGGTAQLISTLIAPFMAKQAAAQTQATQQAPAEKQLPVAPPPAAPAATPPAATPPAATTSEAPPAATQLPPPSAAVEAAGQIVAIAADPDEEDGFSEEKEGQIGTLALAALQGWAGSPEATHQHRAAAYLGWLKTSRSFPDLYQIVKAILSDSLGAVPKHRVIANVATVLHVNWEMVSGHILGKATVMEDADEYDDEDAA